MRPWLGVSLISIEIPGAKSLKDRRQVVRSLLERLKKHYNVSCADLGPDGVWGRAAIAASCVGSSCQEMEARVARLSLFMERAEEEGEFVIMNIEREVFAYGDFQD
jgi:uncharacterized protein YlxP (DUF503 family)